MSTDIRSAIISLRKQGVGPREIARRLDVSPSKVAGVLHRERMCVEPKGRVVTPDRAEIVAYARKHSARAAAQLFGYAPSTVSEWVRWA